MKNIWLDIDLEEYENHMSLPSIAQSQYLSNYFEKVVDLYDPKSVALLGCAGGNGLEKIKNKEIDKAICVDINPNYLHEAEKRYANDFMNIEFICSDISSDEINIPKVDLIFAGLIFEYVDINKSFKNISKILKPSGKLVIILQVPNSKVSEVSPSPYKNLEKLSELFSFVSANKIIELSESYGIELVSKTRSELKSTKKFDELILSKKS